MLLRKIAHIQTVRQSVTGVPQPPVNVVLPVSLKTYCFLTLQHMSLWGTDKHTYTDGQTDMQSKTSEDIDQGSKVVPWVQSSWTWVCLVLGFHNHADLWAFLSSCFLSDAQASDLLITQLLRPSHFLLIVLTGFVCLLIPSARYPWFKAQLLQMYVMWLWLN